MKITIIKDDGTVYKDDIVITRLSLPTIPSDVHALQWNNDIGHIEFVNNVKANEAITELPSWANDALNAWQQAYEAEQTEAARRRAEAAAKAAEQQSQTA